MIETPKPTTMLHNHPASAIHNIEDLVPELVASPDGMSDGAFPSRAQSPVKPHFQDTRSEGMQGTPFPLQGNGISDGQVPEETPGGDATIPSDGIEGSGEKTSVKRVSSVRIAPSSPSASPILSRRASQTVQINGKPVPPESESTDALSSISRSSSLNRSRERSDSTSNTPTSATGRSRRPSTLIPRPGKENETIPPRYANADTDVREEKPNADKEEAQKGDTESDTKTEDDADQATETRPPPRVIVRDFGFTATDPRYRGAFHPIPGEAEDEEDDDAQSTASGASSGWNRFAGRRKSSLGGGGWSGFGFGGFGFGGLSRRFSKSSRRGSQAGLSTAGGDDAESTRSGAGSRRSSVQVGVSESGKSPAPAGIILPPLPHDTDVSLSDLTPSSTADDEPPFGRQYVFGAGAGALLKRGASSGSRLRSSSSAGNEETPIPDANRPTEPDPRASILSQVSEEAHTSDASPTSEAAKWPTDITSSTTSSGTTITPSEPRGKYKVLYEFTAESDHEMSVAEGEILIVGGRWGNLGWVIAERVAVSGEEVMKGLVPEGYLGERIGDR